MRKIAEATLRKQAKANMVKGGKAGADMTNRGLPKVATPEPVNAREKMAGVLKKKAKANQKAGGGDRRSHRSGLTNWSEPIEPIDTREAIANRTDLDGSRCF